MLNYLTTHRSALYAKAEHKLADYGRSLLQADAAGLDTDGWLELALSLGTGIEVIQEATSAEDARTARVIAFLVEHHELDPVALLPFQPTPTLVAGNGGGGPVFFADILGLPEANAALVAYIARQIRTATPTTFTLRPTIATGGIQAGQVYTGNAEFFFRLQNEVYIAPGFPSFALDGQGSRTVEMGTAFPGGSKTFTWTTSTPGNVTANSLSLLDVTAGATLATAQADDGAATATTASFTAIAGESRRYRISGTNTNGATFSTDLVLAGAPRLYFGPATAAPTNRGEAFQLGGTQLTSEGNSAVLNTGTTATQFFIILPPGRTLTQVTDVDNANSTITGSYLLQPALTLANAGGVAVPGHTVYRNQAAAPYPASVRHAFSFS